MDKDTYQRAIELALDWLCSQSDNTQAIADFDKVFALAYALVSKYSQ
jgi:hypothetical protein